MKGRLSTQFDIGYGAADFGWQTRPENEARARTLWKLSASGSPWRDLKRVQTHDMAFDVSPASTLHILLEFGALAIDVA